MLKTERTGLTKRHVFSFSGTRFELPGAGFRASQEAKRTFSGIYRSKKRGKRLFFLRNTGIFQRKYASFLGKGRHNVPKRSACFPEEDASFFWEEPKDVLFCSRSFLDGLRGSQKNECLFSSFCTDMAINNQKIKRSEYTGGRERGVSAVILLFLIFS